MDEINLEADYQSTFFFTKVCIAVKLRKSIAYLFWEGMKKIQGYFFFTGGFCYHSGALEKVGWTIHIMLILATPGPDIAALLSKIA